MPPEDHNPYSGYGAPSRDQLDNMVEAQRSAPQASGGGPAAGVQSDDSGAQLLQHSEALAQQRAELNGFEGGQTYTDQREAEAKANAGDDDKPTAESRESKNPNSDAKDDAKDDGKKTDAKSDAKADANAKDDSKAPAKATAKAADKK